MLGSATALALVIVASASPFPEEPIPGEEYVHPVPTTPQELRYRLVKAYGDPRVRRTVHPTPAWLLRDAELKRGPEGLSLLLHVAFPETAAPPPDEATLERLLSDLQSGHSPEWQSAATTLFEHGPRLRPHLEALLEEAEPAVRLTIRGILWTWDNPHRTVEDLQRHLKGYLVSIRDPALVDVLARHVGHAMGWNGGRRGTYAMAIYRVLATEADEAYTAPFLELLSELPPGEAGALTRFVAQRGRGGRYPPLVLAALESDRPDVIDEAVMSTTAYWDTDHRPWVRKQLRGVFEQSEGTLKFHAAFALMHKFGEPDAERYLLRQIHSRDAAYAEKVLAWFAGACHRGRRRKVYPELLDCVAPFLRAASAVVRRNAVRALGAYRGEAVIRRLAPLLADPEQSVRETAAVALRRNQEPALLRRVLGEEAENATDPDLRQAIHELLERVEAKEASQKP